MDYDYNLWVESHNAYVDAVYRLCELKKNEDVEKCKVACIVMKNAMWDIEKYFKQKTHSVADLIFLIRNIYVIIDCITDITNILVEKGISKKGCFINGDTIQKFTALRSQILAHPINTTRNVDELIYLENIRLPVWYDSFESYDSEIKSYDFMREYRSSKTGKIYNKPLSVSNDIVPVINVIIDSLPRRTNNILQNIKTCEKELQSRRLNVNKESIEQYILSLNEELLKRYPSVIEDIELPDGSICHQSIVFNCLMYFQQHYKTDTQTKYNIFLDYISSELHKIEMDLQNMCFNEDHYFELLYNQDFAQRLSYEKSKMRYLKESDETSYTESDIDSNVESNTLWGIRCFRLLMPYIEQYLPIDVSVSDKGLYCEYLASEYLSNTTATQSK